MVGHLVSPNFSHLRPYDEQLFRLGSLAERYFPDDPNTALLKLRQLGELLAQQVDNGSAINMAASLEIDAVIDPAQTRAWLSRALAAGHTRPLRGGMVDTW